MQMTTPPPPCTGCGSLLGPTLKEHPPSREGDATIRGFKCPVCSTLFHALGVVSDDGKTVTWFAALPNPEVRAAARLSGDFATNLANALQADEGKPAYTRYVLVRTDAVPSPKESD